MKSKKFKNIVTAVVIVLIIIATFYGSRENNVKLTEDSIIIEGMYGREIPKNTITHIKLLEELPRVSLRRNGISIFSLQKGVYKIEGFDKINLYVHGGEKYLLIDSKDRPVIISYKDSTKTEKLYNELNDFLGNR